MNVIGTLYSIANDRMNNESAHDLYLKYSTNLIIKNIEELDQYTLLVTTYPVLENRSILGDKWTEITFKFKYFYTKEIAQELLDEQGYIEFKQKSISVYDFLKIKYIGRKVYKAFHSDSEFDFYAEGRLLDLEEYDDVSKIVHYFRKKVCQYEYRVDDAKYLEKCKEFDEKDNQRYKKEMNKWKQISDELLQNMPDDSN